MGDSLDGATGRGPSGGLIESLETYPAAPVGGDDRPEDAEAPTGQHLEARIVGTGRELLEGLRAALDALPDPSPGPQALATRTGVDKVLASRVLKAVKSGDPLGVMHRAPGPEPLRRLLSGLRNSGVAADRLLPAERAVTSFERLIRDELGDRGALETIVSAWVPEARRAFELRRKQGAFRAMSELKGSQANVVLATVMVAPSAADPSRLDVVWINGLFGLQRLRPGAAVKFATRRSEPATQSGRRVTTLEGEPIDNPADLIVKRFSSSPMPRVDVQQNGETVHYTLAGDRFGPRSAVDVVCAEVNRADMRRYVPREEHRRAFLFAEVSTPTRVLVFDVILHEDVFPGSEPSLRLYDTSFDGTASVNDPSRDIDRLDLLERVEHLGTGIDRCQAGDVPNYGELLRETAAASGIDGSRCRVYRCRIDYPVYGSQVMMAFDAPPPPVA